MVAPAGKAPQRQMTVMEKKKVTDMQRRERRIRRANEPTPLRPPSIKIRQELRKRGSLGPAGEAPSAQTAGETAAAPVVRKEALDGATAAAKTKQKKKTTAAEDVERVVRQTLTDMTCNLQLLADLGSSDEESESESMTRVTTDASCAGPPTSAPTLSTVAAVPPTSTPTSSAGPPTSRPASSAVAAAPPTWRTTSSGPPTSAPTSSAVAVAPPTSRPTSSVQPPTSAEGPTTPARGRPRARALPISAGKRKRIRTGNMDSSASELEGNADVVREEVADEGENVGDEDPCFVGEGKAEKETALDSESEESSSEIGEFGEDEDEEEELWELVCPSDEEEGDATEELPDREFLKTATNKKPMKDMRKAGWEYDPAKFGADPQYEDLYEGPYGPSPAVLRVAEDPLALFFFFMPPQLWRKIQKETNVYHMQNIEKRVVEIRKAQRKADPDDVESKKDVRARLRSVEPVKPAEILRLIGLLIARMLCPHAKGLSAHWRKRQHGAVPLGTFGHWLARNHFDHVMQNLHFTNNKSSQAGVDRGWKVRSVVTMLQKTFARGYRVGPVIAFDEAIIPTRSRRNPTRQYLPQKPHKWGTKFFAACCGETAYCMRIEMYVGAKSHLAVPPAADNSCGAAAVVRNLDVLLPRSSCSPYRIVVTDRYYTFIVLALELFHRRIYLTGTIQTRRAGFAEGVITKKKVYKKKPSEPVRGTVELAENKKFPQITAAMWMDNHPVHMVSSGGSRVLGSVYRRVGSDRQNFPAPGLVRDYQRWMGDVDIHDQLRMQRYSIQLAYKPKKYYRSIFFGLVDMAIVNAFIVHRHHMKSTG